MRSAKSQAAPRFRQRPPMEHAACTGGAAAVVRVALRAVGGGTVGEDGPVRRKRRVVLKYRGQYEVQYCIKSRQALGRSPIAALAQEPTGDRCTGCTSGDTQGPLEHQTEVICYST